MAIQKKILVDKPEIGDKSLYCFSEEYNTDPPIYNDSISLPENNDKFQNKDLFTKCVGDDINESIIEKNLKFQGDPFIKIENLYISNTGVDGTVKSNHVAGWIFSQEAYGGDPTKDGYSTVKSKMKDEWKFYSQGFGSRNEGTDIGNVTEVEGTPIIADFGVESAQITIPDFEGIQMTLDDIPETFKLSNLEPTPSQTSILNESQYNPIYIVIYMRGHKKVAWPVNTDERKRKYDIFKISNDELFERVGSNYLGITYQTNFTSATKTKTGEGGGGAQAAAWKVTSLRLTINTSAGVKNSFSGVSNYQEILPLILPKTKLNENTFNSVDWLASANPKVQLDNTQDSDYPNTTLSKGFYRHPDFIPITTFGFSQDNQLGNNYVDLQTYNNDFNLVMKSSAPLNVTFNIDLKSPNGDDLKHYYSYDSYPELIDEEDDSDFPIGVVGDQLFYYFIIDWDDKDNKFQTLDNWLDSKPENQFDYLEKQNQNLYKVKKINYTQGTNNGLLSNVYTTPGIKNIKYIMFSVFNGNGQNNWSPGFEVGRWKLCTSRIYLDIPPNQYPDFSDVGGNDYTTLPWPFTTAIINGVSNESKYKISIENILNGGKVGDFDIIDERFLIDDLDNDEMGHNIETMDLEQCRYFNTSYGINELLNIPVENETIDLSQPSENFYNPTTTLADDENTNTDPDYLATLPFPQYIEEFDLNGNSEVDFEDAGLWPQAMFPPAGRPDISDMLYNLYSGGEPPSFYTYPDYVYEWTDWSSIKSGIVTNSNFNLYNDFSYWNGTINKFSEESSVGQIFISDNQDNDLKQNCKLELNTSIVTNNSILDSSGNSNKGLLIGDYKVKKSRKGQPMRKDSFIKVPKKTGNTKGAL